MKETDLEAEMTELGIARYRSRLAKNRSAKLETCSTAGQRVLERAVHELTNGLDAWVATASTQPGRMHRVLPLMTLVPLPIVSMLTCRCVIDGIAASRTINSLAAQVGRLVEDEYRFRKIRKDNPSWWSKMTKLVARQSGDLSKTRFIKKSAKLHSMSLPSWSTKDRVALGLVCIELMKQHTGVIEIVNRTNVLGKDVTLVRGTDEFIAWLEKSHGAAEFMQPVYIPMVVKPVPWDSVWNGGYLGTSFGRRPLVKVTNKRYLQTLDSGDLSTVFAAVNRIQDTRWQVNGNVLDVLKNAWENGLSIGDLPGRNSMPIPAKPVDIDTNEEARRQWRKSAARAHFDNDCLRSKRIAVGKTLWLADKYGQTPMHFPQELDFRGRVYPKPVFLNNQGSDWQRSLLKFADGKPVDDDGMMWLMIHGANMWGLDKVAYNKRIDFIEQNLKAILAVGKDPLSDNFWTNADKPWAFLAFCVELAAIHADRSYASGLPVHVDGSNNGLQIFSLLLKDPLGATATNCVPLDNPEDIYQRVADLVNMKLAASDRPEDRVWLDFGIDRKTTKRVVMCLPYGLTEYSSREYVRDWYLDKARSTGKRAFEVEAVFNEVGILTKYIWESIREIVVSAVGCMDWLKACARIHVECGQPIRWTSPSGFLVEQGYKKMNRVVVKTSIGSVLRQHRILVDGEHLSMSRNVNAISPNVVHSIDASVLMESVVRAGIRDVNSFSCIHDSFGTVAADMGKMAYAIREVSVEIFSQPILKTLQSEMQAYLPKGVDLPSPPVAGTLDINQLLKAEYFFA